MLLYVDALYASPYAMSAFVALREKGVPFRMQTVNLQAGQNKEAEYTALSLTQRVPVLVDGAFALAESSAIAEYVNETQPGAPLYPAAPQLRARARQVQAWLRSDLMPLRQERSTEVIFCGHVAKPLSAEAQAAVQKLFSVASALLPEGSENLFGAWCMADTDLALMLNRLVAHGDFVPPHLATWTRRQWERPSVQAWCNQPRPSL